MEAIGTLAGGIAHDFNNILFPIIGYTEMMKEDISNDSPHQESLGKIYSGALRARELVKQILTFSRQDIPELKLIKMQTVIKEVLKLIRSTISRTIHINYDIRDDCGAIKADSTEIHQILMNLISNATHAMEETGGELYISLKEVVLDKSWSNKPGVYVCLVISDTGAGMAKEVMKKMYDPFFTTKEQGKGTGMGLSVVHGIVNNMGGVINVDSKPDKGTTFYLYFPVEKHVDVKSESNIQEDFKTGNEQILLVDDEENIIAVEKQILTRLGYNVVSCLSGIDAFELFKADPESFDIVITDMAMPGMSGVQLSEKIGKIRPEMPILLCTGFSKSITQEKAISYGIKGFLNKPVSIGVLADKIREVLGSRK